MKGNLFSLAVSLLVTAGADLDAQRFELSEAADLVEWQQEKVCETALAVA